MGSVYIIVPDTININTDQYYEIFRITYPLCQKHHCLHRRLHEPFATQKL